jgi:DNA-binding response OmpR family regulator
MPGMSGEELTRNARMLRPSLKVLYTSGYTRDAISSGGRLNPDVALLHKPFALNDLAIRIRQVLDMR